jgi:hypothetical protein
MKKLATHPFSGLFRFLAALSLATPLPVSAALAQPSVTEQEAHAIFWSVTLCGAEGFRVPNALNRFAVSNWMPFEYNPDGSLDLYFQNISPGKDKEANWLPAPKGPFNLLMRLYGSSTSSTQCRVIPRSRDESLT